MTDTARSVAGFRHATVFELMDIGSLKNVLKIPTSGSDVAYEGVQISGVKSLTLTDPPARQIIHTGDDGIVATMTMPPNTAATGTLTTAKTEDALEELMTQSRSTSLGQGIMFPIGANNKGNEPYLCMLVYAQSVNTTKGSSAYGTIGWEGRLLPLVRFVPQDTGFSDAAAIKTYQLFPQNSTQYPWGEEYSLVNQGYTEAFAHRTWTPGKPKLVTFRGNNSRTEFALPTNYPAKSTSSIQVWVNGTPKTSGLSLTTTAITFSPAPAEDAHIVVFYETEYD